MRLVPCTLELVRGTPHAQQILAGYLELQRLGALSLRVRVLPRSAGTAPYLLKATVAGAQIGYDTQDGFLDYHIDTNRHYLEASEAVFVRSFRSDGYGPFGQRVHPLGLNFAVVNSLPSQLRAYSASPTRALKDLLSPNRRPRTRRFFEAPPRLAPGGPVLFLSRVWEPDGRHPGDIEAMNAMRASLVRQLRGALGDRFIGGLAPTPYAMAAFSDCVVERSLTTKTAFRAAIEAASVCVTTAGVAGSNGWKLAEYVAASKPIVTERLQYGVPGDFTDGLHYRSFMTPEECVDQVTKYLTTPDLALASSWENWKYYNAWVRPDAMVRYSLIEGIGLRLSPSP